MQTEYELKSAVKTLPPPQSNTDIKDGRRQKAALAAIQLLCLICATAALAVTVLSTVQRVREILSKGLLDYTAAELLCLESGSGGLGDRVSAVAFGTNQTDIKSISLTPPQTVLPRVYYIPKEKIVEKVFEEKAEASDSLAELYAVSKTDIPSGAYPIIPTDLSAKEATDLKNETSFKIDMSKILKEALLLPKADITKEPLVLIVHTHGTEGFVLEENGYYSDKINNPRTEDVSKNIVAVGKVIADELNRKGIPTIHCETMHDKDSYIKAYERSAESIRSYVEKYPSIKYVFDVHRDSLIRSDLTKLRPVTLYKGEATAQIMMIVGSNEKSGKIYDWQSNLVLAEALQQELFKNAGGTARQIYLRGATYNQQYTQNGLLLEIGSCGNTLSEAKNAAKAFAEAFINVIYAQ